MSAGPGVRRLRTAILWVLAAAILAPIALLGSGAVKHFNVPAESMAPTLVKGDRFVARMDGAGELQRGEIILLRVGKSTYVKRIAGLPGDRIAMRDGVVVLNGRVVPQRMVGTEAEARRLAERFPGEAAEHFIYDLGPQPFDQMAERIVPSGHVFVLGDNRDLSADSRVARIDMGVEMAPITDILGRPLFRTWGPSGKTGESLSH